MSTIKNGQVTLYCCFNKIIKEPGTSFQSPALNQKHVRNVCTLVFDQIFFLQYLGFKRTKDKCNFHYVAMSMMTSQILKFEDFTKTQISGERNIIFSSNKKNYLHIKGYLMSKNSFAAEVTFNRVKVSVFRVRLLACCFDCFHEKSIDC